MTNVLDMNLGEPKMNSKINAFVTGLLCAMACDVCNRYPSINYLWFSIPLTAAIILLYHFQNNEEDQCNSTRP